jgi:hypothetical protein
VFEPDRVPHPLGSARQYREKAQHYRASAAAATNASQREAFELLADTFDRLAADYERIESSRD